MKFFYLLTMSMLVLSGIKAQHLGAYSDYRDRFFVFDHGKQILLEDQQVHDFRVGGNCILYLNSLNRLKIYKNGQVKLLEMGAVSKIYATDYIAAYSVFDKLIVIENGEPRILSHRSPLFEVEDSLIVFFDKNKASLRVYYDGHIEDIENGLMGMPVAHLKSSDNIIAYISDNTKDFKIYYKGTLHTIIRHIDRISYKAGKDIVAYINEMENSFNIFYKGEIIQLEDFPPKSYRMGDGFVAYVDDMGNFKVFYQGKIIEISSYAPDSYICKDNLMLFSEYDYLSLFNKGEVYEVESFIPKNFKMDWNTIAYIDHTNRVWMFSDGKKEYLLNDVVQDFAVFRDLIVLNLSMKRNAIFYQGKMYDGASY